MLSHPAHLPHETRLPEEVPLRALWWGQGKEMDRCAIQGSPTSIVLLHGLGDGADIWRPMLAAWPNSQRTMPVMALDLPGHGGSGHLAAGGYRIEELAGIVAAALARLRITHPVLIGHSLGARVALTLAARRLVAAPRATILIDWSPEANDGADAAVAEHIDALIAGTPHLEGLLELACARLPMAQVEAVRAAISAMVRAADTGWHLPLDPAIKALLQTVDETIDPWGLLKSLPGPVGIVRGAYSSVLRKADAARMAAVTPRPAVLETIAQAGHAIPLEQPATLASSLQRLIGQMVGEHGTRARRP